MHRFVRIAASCVLSAALILGVSPLASFGLQAASAADTPKETPATEQDLQSGPATYAAETLEEGDAFVCGDLTYTVTDTDDTPEAMLGHYYFDDSDQYARHTENAPADGFTGGDIILPDTVTYDGVDYTVTAIDDYAFYNDTSITSLTIPASVITIGDYAFSGCSNIATIHLNEGLVNVGSYGLSVGTEAGASSLTELTIPASVQTIGSRGFSYLRYLEKLTFTDTQANPSQLASIGGSAFAASSRSSSYYNKVLTDIRIPSTVTSISTAVFAYDTALQTVIFECDTSDMKYKTSTSNSALSTAWFYGYKPDENTAVVFTKGTPPVNWDTDIPSYMCLSFYEDENEAAADEGLLGKAAVAYDTPCYAMLETPGDVKTFVFDDYETIPVAPEGEFTTWVYEGMDTLLLSVTSAGRLYPGNVDLNDLQYATVTIDGSPIPSAYNYSDFDSTTFLNSIQVFDFTGNLLTADTDYDARIEQPASLGPATLIIEGKDSYSGVYEQSIQVTIDSFVADDESGHAFTYVVTAQPVFDENGTVISNGTVQLGNGSDTAYTGSVSDITTADIPATVGESITGEAYSFDISEIASKAFSGFTALRSVSVPSTVTSIGREAFYGCRALTELTFAEGLQSIGDYAFAGCIALTEVEFPNSLINLGVTSAFDTISGAYVFNNCTALEKVVFGAEEGGGSATISTRAFDGCNALKEIYLNGNVDTLTVYSLFELPALTKVTGLYGVSVIGFCAFYGCSNLAFTDTEEEGVLTLGDVTLNSLSFGYCTSLTTLRLGTGIELGHSAPGFTYSWDSGYAFSDSGITTVEFEEGWTEILTCFFAGMTNLTSISIPETVTTIGSRVFSECTSLKSITLPSALESIGSSSFNACTSLIDVQFLSSGTDLILGDQLFTACRSLQAISIPEGVTTLPSGCFSGCTSLETVTLPSTLTNIETSCFGRSYDSLVESEEPAYIACTSLKTIEIPASVTYIGIYAFDGCSALTGPLDLSNVSELEDYTFRDCSSLDNVTVAGDVSLGIGVFYDCESLTTLSDGSATSGVVLPENMGEMGQNAFYGCSSLESLTVPAALVSVPRGTFSGCTALVELTLSEGVEALGQESFADCTSLKAFTTPATLAEIGTSAFSGCSKLTDLQLAEGLQSIGREAFAGCTTLPYVVLPSTVVSIDSGAFSSCYDLDAVDCTAVDTDAADIAADAFATGNTDTCLVFVQMDAPKGLELDNGHVLSVTCPEKVTYTGKELTPVVLACTDGADAEDFCWVIYADNLIPGTASATVYVGAYEIEFTFEIENDGTYDPNNPPGAKQPITASMVSDIPTQYYTGKAIKPAVKVGSYQQGTDYTVSYSNNVDIGTAKATVTPSASIGGSPVTKTFKITVKKNAAYKVGSVTYKIAKAQTDGKGTVTLAKYTKGKNITVPAKVKIGGVSFKVAEIGAKAIKGAKKLKNIQIGSSVKKIGKKAFFGCKKLKVVLFTGKKLPKLGKQAFAKTPSKVTVGVKSKPAQAEKKLRKAGLSKKAVVVKA